MPLCKKRTMTPARIAANRANSQQSTGPRTVEGKRRVMWNALKHGQRSGNFRRALIRSGDDVKAYDRLCWMLVALFQPTLSGPKRSKGPGRRQVELLSRRMWCERREKLRSKSRSQVDSFAWIDRNTELIIKSFALYSQRFLKDNSVIGIARENSSISGIPQHPGPTAEAAAKTQIQNAGSTPARRPSLSALCGGASTGHSVGLTPALYGSRRRIRISRRCQNYSAASCRSCLRGGRKPSPRGKRRLHRSGVRDTLRCHEILHELRVVLDHGWRLVPKWVRNHL